LDVRREVDPPPHKEPAKQHRIFTTSFASVYPHDGRKAETTGRHRLEVDQVICWRTGYSPEALAAQIERQADFETIFGEAPGLHPDASKISGVICGVRIEEIEDPLMRNIRYLVRLVDELAKGRPMEKVLRTYGAARAGRPDGGARRQAAGVWTVGEGTVPAGGVARWRAVAPAARFAGRGLRHRLSSR
jgi:hypothetical protein